MDLSKKYQEDRRIHWENVANQPEKLVAPRRYYHKRLSEIYQFVVSPKLSVLEIGCGKGDLLASVKPRFGVGLDLSPHMLQIARRRHPDLYFVQADGHVIPFGHTFDVIILSDLINDLWDVQAVLEQIHAISNHRTRIVINVYSKIWEMPLKFAQRFGMMSRLLSQNWLAPDDIRNLFYLSGFEVMRCWQEILWPVKTPIISGFMNRFLVKIWPFKWFALTNFTIARKIPENICFAENLAVSIIVPARNEAGNVEDIFNRTPRVGRSTELVFVEGHSDDETFSKIETEMSCRPEWRCQLLRQPGKGKGDAVRAGFSASRGDILMILDADMTVPPEDLPRFYNALVSGKGDFINGVRLIYPMQKRAMRYINMIGNKFFSLAFSWLLGQPIKDTLCGTKVLWKRDYKMIELNRSYFGDFDPFGDFDLLFGAAKINAKILDMPIRYNERIYGDTNIQRWRHGWMLLKMVIFAAKRIKFK